MITLLLPAPEAWGNKRALLCYRHTIASETQIFVMGLLYDDN